MIRVFGIVTFAVCVLSACTDPVAENKTSREGADITSVTDITDVTTPAGSNHSTTAGGRSEPSESSPSASAAEPEVERPLVLDLSVPEQSESNYLFAEKDNTPNYFQSSDAKEGIKWKGKLYMVDEPSPDKRIDNVEGAEVGVVVPLK